MKKLLFIAGFLFLFISTSFSQTPAGINYQAVARDESGNVMANKALSFKISLASRLGNGNNVYSEVHKMKTNEFGLVNFVIGRGEVISGSFDDIPWAEGNVWMEVAIDRENTGNFISMGSNELLSVPYAMHARTATSLLDGENSQNDLIGQGQNPSERNAPTCANATCPCEVGTDWIELLYNGDPIVGDVEFYNNNINGTPFQTASGISDNDTIRVDRSGNLALPSNLKIKVFPTGDPMDYFVVCLDPGCQSDIVGLSYGPFSVISRMDKNGNYCTIDDGNPAWTLRGNVLQAPVNKFGTLNQEDVVYISSNIDRGIMTKDGDFGLGTLTPEARLHVNGGQQIIDNPVASYNWYDEEAYGLIVNSPMQGMMIRLTAHDGRQLPLSSTPSGENPPDNDNHFITFMGANGDPLGRIEGEAGHSYDIADYTNDADWVLEIAEREAADYYAVNAVAFASVDLGLAISNAAQLAIDQIASAAATGAAAGCTAVDPCISPVVAASEGTDVAVLIVLIVDAATQIANSTAALASAVDELTDIQSFNQTAYTNKITYRGVVYASGGADYSEFLERAIKSEVLKPGDIVGLHAGKISLQTSGAHEFRVITTNPVVLGNMPPEGKEQDYDRVGFLGQVPTRVRGIVHTGDYILPSGLNDGIGVAKSAEEMSIEDFSRIIGRAWSSKSTSGIGMVNVAIGLNSNDLAVVSRKQQNEIDRLSAELQKVVEVINGMKGGNLADAEIMPFATGMGSEKKTFDQSAFRKALEMIKLIYSLDPTFLGREEIASNPYFTEVFSSDANLNAYLSSITTMMAENGYEILSGSNSGGLEKGSSISPSFTEFDANEIYNLFSETKISDNEKNLKFEKIRNDKSKQDEIVKTIQIGQEISKFLLN